MPTIESTTSITERPAPSEAISGRQCPVCRSYETQRHVEGRRVWFTCTGCGAVFS